MKSRNFLLSIVLLCLITACSQKPQNSVNITTITLRPMAETEAVIGKGDAADDPAVWINRKDPGQSLILGTQKQTGLYVYNLSGEVRQFLPDGRLNNIDLRYGFDLQNGRVVDIAAASNRSTNKVTLYTIDTETGLVSLLEDARIPDSKLDEVYGLCMAHLKQDDSYRIFVIGKSGGVEHYQLSADSNYGVVMYPVNQWTLPSQAEGCVVDDYSGLIYIAEEEAGIWRYPVNAELNPQGELLVKTDGERLAVDVEGLALYSENMRQLLFASSQGNDTYAVYDVMNDGLEYLANIRIIETPSIDGTSGTDGIEVVNNSFSGRFPGGLLVVQDDVNTSPEENQNFKMVSLEPVLNQLLN